MVVKMSELIRFEIRELPRLYLVAKELRYSMEALMQGDNRLPAFWGQCFGDGTFETLDKCGAPYEDASVGLMADWDKGDGDFSYLIGVLFTSPVEIPAGFIGRTLEPCSAAIGWLRGKDTADVCGDAHEKVEAALREKGLSCDNMPWSMELYNCPRFTTPDENGLLTLDYYIPCSTSSAGGNEPQ